MSNDTVHFDSKGDYTIGTSVRQMDVAEQNATPGNQSASGGLRVFNGGSTSDVSATKKRKMANPSVSAPSAPTAQRKKPSFDLNKIRSKASPAKPASTGSKEVSKEDSGAKSKTPPKKKAKPAEKKAAAVESPEVTEPEKVIDTAKTETDPVVSEQGKTAVIPESVKQPEVPEEPTPSQQKDVKGDSIMTESINKETPPQSGNVVEEPAPKQEVPVNNAIKSMSLNRLSDTDVIDTPVSKMNTEEEKEILNDLELPGAANAVPAESDAPATEANISNGTDSAVSVESVTDTPVEEAGVNTEETVSVTPGPSVSTRNLQNASTSNTVSEDSVSEQSAAPVVEDSVSAQEDVRSAVQSGKSFTITSMMNLCSAVGITADALRSWVSKIESAYRRMPTEVFDLGDTRLTAYSIVQVDGAKGYIVCIGYGLSICALQCYNKKVSDYSAAIVLEGSCAIIGDMPVASLVQATSKHIKL